MKTLVISFLLLSNAAIAQNCKIKTNADIGKAVVLKPASTVMFGYYTKSGQSQAALDCCVQCVISEGDIVKIRYEWPAHYDVMVKSGSNYGCMGGVLKTDIDC